MKLAEALIARARYRFNGNEWIEYNRSEDGFWESEPGTFPAESLFPTK